jgi:putative endonuclease
MIKFGYVYIMTNAYFDLAIRREKELKKWNRQKKEGLINNINPKWEELVNEQGFIKQERDSSLRSE